MSPKFSNKLTDTAIKKAKPPKTGTKNLTDGEGLRLLITPNGSKRWLMEYISPVTGKRRLAGFGRYYDDGHGVSLDEAREKREEFRRMIRQKKDPLDEAAKEKEALKREKEAQKAQQQTFEKVAREWFDVKTRELSVKTREALDRGIRYLLPHIGQIPLKDLRVADARKALEPLFDRVETCKRAAAVAHSVCRYGASMGYVDGDFLSALSDVLPNRRATVHHAAITDPQEFGLLLQDIDDYGGDISTCYCLKILPYVFLRSTEIRHGRWDEVDLAAGVWTIPAARMKKTRAKKEGGHVVPLARQVVDMLWELKDHTGHTGLLFPAPSDRNRAISDNGLTHALRRMGYTRETMTVHGFRAAARTMLDEVLHCDRNLIEVQLAHTVPGPMGDTYNRSEYLPARREMMQRWADFLDGLRAQRVKR